MRSLLARILTQQKEKTEQKEKGKEELEFWCQSKRHAQDNAGYMLPLSRLNQFMGNVVILSGTKDLAESWGGTTWAQTLRR